MNLIKNNLITGDLCKYSISCLESLYLRLCCERIDLQIQISVKIHRKAYLDILPRNYGILNFGSSVEVQELLKELEKVHSECLDCFWTCEYLKAPSRYHTILMTDFEASLTFYDFWETLNDIQQKEFMKYADKYSDSYMSTTKIIDFLKHDEDYLKKVLLFMAEAGEPIEIFGKDVSIHA